LAKRILFVKSGVANHVRLCKEAGNSVLQATVKYAHACVRGVSERSSMT